MKSISICWRQSFLTRTYASMIYKFFMKMCIMKSIQMFTLSFLMSII